MGMITRRTSFEALIESFDADAPARWPLKGKSLRYGQLQCAIEVCCQSDSKDKNTGNNERAQRTDPDRFFDTLADEVRRVDRNFERAALRLLKPNSWAAKLRFGALRMMRSQSAEERQREKIANEVHWCQQYAAINHIALQRVVEQYDRCAESKAGAKFLQDCWSPATDLGFFLKTPLLDDLHALKLMLLKSSSPRSPVTPRSAEHQKENSPAGHNGQIGDPAQGDSAVTTPPRRTRSSGAIPPAGARQIGHHHTGFALGGNLFAAGDKKVPPSPFAGSGGVFDRPFKTGKDSLKDVAGSPVVHPVTESAA